MFLISICIELNKYNGKILWVLTFRIMNLMNLPKLVFCSGSVKVEPIAFKQDISSWFVSSTNEQLWNQTFLLLSLEIPRPNKIKHNSH